MFVSNKVKNEESHSWFRTEDKDIPEPLKMFDRGKSKITFYDQGV